MQNKEHLARLVLECMPEHESAALEDRRYLADELSRIIEKRFGAVNLPRSGETVAVTLDKPKTGALFFDRVWFAPGMSGGPQVDGKSYMFPLVSFAIEGTGFFIRGTDGGVGDRGVVVATSARRGASGIMGLRRSASIMTHSPVQSGSTWRGDA